MLLLTSTGVLLQEGSGSNHLNMAALKFGVIYDSLPSVTFYHSPHPTASPGSRCA